MDKLTKLCLDHTYLSERMAFFEKLIEAIESGDLENYIDKIQFFIDEYIVKHFKFEEEKIFPMIIQHGSPEEKMMVQELQQEHALILRKLDTFKEKLLRYNSSLLKSDVETIIEASKGIVRMILMHAQKEDERLFPNL
ncbi:hemerythrin domain-containing protein [Candidatus Electrothrix sp.]|uniref:hemerythrin domain-containing protein n=1 Tax=Candidatus Electrothrix sp. TaxID=2170559 RepID=UPI0040565386